MSEPKNNPNRLVVLKEFLENCKLIEGYIRILKSNYDKNREKTINIINSVGWNIEIIKGLQEKYNMYPTGKVPISIKDVEESQQILGQLKKLCEVVVYDNTRENENLYISKNSDKRQLDTVSENPNIEHVEAEIVTAEEFAEIRKREQKKREERETDAMFRVINENAERAKVKRMEQFGDDTSRVEYGRVSGMEDGRTKTETSISSFTLDSSVRSTKQKDFRKKMADMARSSESTTMPISEIYQERTGSRQTINSDKTRGKREDIRYGRQENYGETARQRSNNDRGGRRLTSERTTSSNKSRNGKRLSKRNIKNKAKTLDKRSLIRRLAAGALAVSLLMGANAIHKNNEYKEDVENRIQYVDNIIDKKGTAEDYISYLSLDFTDEEMNKFLEVEEKIDSYQGKSSTDLSVVDIITTANEFKGIYRDIIRERLEEGFGYKIEDNEIEVVRERDDLDGHPGDLNENGHVSQISYMQYIKKRDIPKELRNAIIAAYGEEGIEKPTMTVEQLIYKLDNQEINKAEASEYLGFMLEDAKELMTRQYEKNEQGKLKEIDSTYTIVKEREKEQAKMQNEDEMDR